MIVKITSYIRRGKAAKSKARAFVRYIKHRPDREGERATRALFGADGIMEKHLAYDMIEEANQKGIFYRLALSPDPKREDTYKDLDLLWMTQVAMRYLQEKLGIDCQFVAAEHGDQTDIRHVNALLLMPGRLTKEQFRLLPKLLKEAAAADVRLQRQILDQTIAPEPESPHAGKLPSPHVGEVEYEYRHTRPLRPTCIDCGPQQHLWLIDEGTYKCPECGATYGTGYQGIPVKNIQHVSL